MADPTSNTKELLTLEVGADTKKALLEVTRFQRHVSTKMKKVQESTQKVDKGFTRFMKQVQGARTKSRGIKELTSQFKALDKVVSDRADLVADAIRNARKTKRGSQERKDLMARIKEIKEASGYRQAFGARQGARRSSKELKETTGFDWKDMRDGAEEAGEAFTEPLRDLLSRDAPTLMRRMTKTLLSAHEGAMKARAKGAEWSKAGSQMMARGGLLNKVGGGAAKAGGELTKMFGGLAGIITKIGPLLSVASSFMMSFVKILIDAEAAAKDFNKQILATTGTSSFLRRNFGDVGAATEDLGKSLRAARDGAMDLSMIQWGISKEAAAAFQTAITAEGVALDRLGNATKGATASAETHAKTIQMGVAYSRAFGISLSEIAQLQGSLMADLGMGAKGVQASFQTIVEGAHQAGMETNKFFGIIRSFSSDLSLFTLRLAEVSKVMGVLGKTMDPRKMGQFIQTLHGKFKGGLLENLKLEMLAGNQSRQIVKEDAADKLANLSSDLKEALGRGSESAIAELMKILTGSRDPLKIAQWQAKHQDKLNGTLNDSIQENVNVQTKLATGDKIDQAALMDNLAPLRKLETLNAIANKNFGRSLDKLSGIQLVAMEEMTGTRVDEIEMFKRLSQGILQGQAELVQRVRSGRVSPADLAQMSKLGVQSSGEEGAAALERIFRSADGQSEYMRSLDKSQRELLDGSAKEIDYQKQTADFQTSLLDKIGIATDILLNKIYNMMTDIWKVITDIYFSLPWVSGDKKEMAQAKTLANDSNLPELAAAIGSAKSGEEAAGKIISTIGRDTVGSIQKAVKEYEEIKRKLAVEKDPTKRKALIDRGNALRPALNHASKDEKYLQDLNRSQGPRAMLNRILEMRQAAASVPGLGGASTPAPVKPTERQVEQMAKPQEATTASVDRLQRTVANDGIKLAPSTVSGPLSDAMAKSVYEGAAKALFEYYMYSGLSRTTVATALGAGVSPAAIAQSMTSGLGPETAITGLMAPKPNAIGGTVTGIANDLAKVTRFPPAPPGEGWAAVGRGEKILPAGAGGGGGPVKVELELKGDFKRFIKASIIDGAAAHDRNKRLR